MSSYATEVVRQLVKVSAIDTERGSTLTPWLGAVPYAGPALASMAASATAPPGEHILRGTGAGGRAALMALLGTIPGAALGAPIGALIDSHDRGRGAAGGATVGAILGSMAGGAYGAHTGRRLGIEDAAALRQQAAEMARKKESAVNENLFILRGKRAAVEKLGLHPILSMIGRGALAGGGIGAASGGLTGFLAAPQGEGGRGFLRGALAGGATGALGGGLAGGLGARSMMRASGQGSHAIQGLGLKPAFAGSRAMTGGPVTPEAMQFGRSAQLLRENPALRPGFYGAAGGAAGAGVLGGGLAGAAATPEPPSSMERFSRWLDRTRGSMTGTGMPFLQ